MVASGNLASLGLLAGQNALALGLLLALALDVAYFAYFWSSRGQSPGVMAFSFKVREAATGQYPTVGRSALRGFVWILEAFMTIGLAGANYWAWQWDPQKRAMHDKIAGTIVTTN